MTTVLKSTHRKIWYLSACKKSTSSLTSFSVCCKDIVNLLFWKLWECLIIPIKIIVPIYKLSCLSACKILNLSLTFLFRYCKKITKLLFCLIWANLSPHIYNDNTNLKKTLTFICRQKINFILHVFLETLQKYCKLVLLGTLVMPAWAHPKYHQLAENFCVHLQTKKFTLSTMFFWRYCQDMQTCYLGHFGHAWPCATKMIIKKLHLLPLS